MTTLMTAPPSLDCPPRFRICPKHVDPGWGDLAVDFANKYIGAPGERLYDWQEDIQRVWFSVDAYDPSTGYYNTYTYRSCGLIVARQNGKTKRAAVPRMLVGAIFKHEKIRYSAQRVDTMLETFKICVSIVGDPDDPRQRGMNPELFEYCRPKVSFVNGHQKITFEGGGEISFVSRSRDAGRGNTADVNIFDEAQTLTDQQLADSLPNVSAAESGNPQVIFIGTPPEPERDSGEAFSRIRDAALKETPGYCWHEWSVAEVGDVTDESRWHDANPSLGKSLLLGPIRDHLSTMTPLVFAIEHLCYWPQTARPQLLDPAKWDAMEVKAGPRREDIKKMAAGVKFTPNGQVCLSAAAMRQDGTVFAELVSDKVVPQNSADGMTQLISWLYERRDRLSMIAIDGKTGAGELEERLKRELTPNKKRAFSSKQIHVMRTFEVPVAASMVMNGLAEQTLTHSKQDVLNASAHAAEKRKIGSDGLGFGGDSCPIESYAAAVWAVHTAKLDPTRKQRMWK